MTVRECEKMNESNSLNEKPIDKRKYDPELLKKGLRCNLDQLEMLKRCSDKKDMTEWNQWRECDPKEKILLKGANLKNAYLKGANLRYAILNKADLWQANLENADFYKACMEGADLMHAILKKANLGHTNLKGAIIEDTNLESVDFRGAILENASFDNANIKRGDLSRANLKSANLEGANLQDSILWEANLQGTNLRKSYLNRANFRRVNLQCAGFGESHLQGADFSRAIVDGGTLIWGCEVNRKTMFEGVGLSATRIYPDIKQLLESNIRRKNWEKWYKKGRLWKRILKRIFVWTFWEISDYGISTKRIIFTFFGLAFLFAVIYWFFAFISPPGIVSNLSVVEDTVRIVSKWLLPLRAVYFSIVTMTTLGFGDMYANAQSIWGHILLTIQVILGYVLLGALVTRFAVLFTAGGPAGKFADEKEDEKK
jgi:uncharacterized protein YjbI with pentapeptide repeats